MSASVDAHHHVWDLAVRDQPWIDPTTMAPLHRSFPLSELPRWADRTIVVQTVGDPAETRELLALGPPVAAVVGWADLTADDVAERLAALRAGPGGRRLAGIRHQVQDEADPDWLDRREVRRGLAAVGAAGLVYELLVTPRQLPAALRVARDLPDVSFVLDHLAKPDIRGGQWEPWASNVTELAALDNLTAKLSGLVTEADWDSWRPSDLAAYVDHALRVFGPDRLMFGSDWPVCTLAATYDEVVAAAEETTSALGSHERQAVFGATAARIYRLDASRAV